MEFMIYEDLAKYLRKSERYLQRLVATEQIPFHRLPGGGIRFRKSDIDKWLEGHSFGPGK